MDERPSCMSVTHIQSTHVSKISHSWNDYTCECKREVALFKNSCPCCVGNISPAEVISCTERTVAFCRRQNNCHWRHKAGSFWYDDGYFVLQRGNSVKVTPNRGYVIWITGSREGLACRWLHHLAVGVSREPIFARPSDENIDLLVWSSCCYFHHSLHPAFDPVCALIIWCNNCSRDRGSQPKPYAFTCKDFEF